MLKHLHLVNFRSYSTLELELSERVLLILGPNATGKTNILEAMYVAATGRSFRADDVELVQHDSEGYRVDAQYTDELITVVHQVSGAKKSKRFLRESVGIARHTLLGLHPVVLFEPNDLLLLAGPPERRRRYLDLVLTQTDTSYRQAYILYRRLLRQRNALLWHNRQQPLSGLEDQLFILDAQITEPAEHLLELRQTFLAELKILLNDITNRIARRTHQLEIKFVDKTSDFMERLTRSRQRDILLGTTTVGPHREDWQVIFDGHPLTATASRGEVRTTLLALKLAEVDYIRKHAEVHSSQITPLLLLDDVFSELDEARRRFLIRELADVQTVITSTDIDKRLKLPAQTIDLTLPGGVS